MTYPLENQHTNLIILHCHRHGSQLGVASCTFVRTLRLSPQRTPKVTCQQRWGGKTVATPYSLSDEPETAIQTMKKKCIRLEIRLTPDESLMFQNKAQNYGGNMSAMVRDAVRRFDDKRTRGKIETMEVLLQFYKKYQQQLSWLGGNFNQCMHRANELAIAGELSEEYFRSILFPETRKAVKAIMAVKAELDAIHDKQEET